MIGLFCTLYLIVGDMGVSEGQGRVALAYLKIINNIRTPHHGQGSQFQLLVIGNHESRELLWT